MGSTSVLACFLFSLRLDVFERLNQLAMRAVDQTLEEVPMQLGTIVCCFEGEVDPDWRWFEGPMADTGVRFEIGWLSYPKSL